MDLCSERSVLSSIFDKNKLQVLVFMERGASVVLIYEFGKKFVNFKELLVVVDWEFVGGLLWIRLMGFLIIMAIKVVEFSNGGYKIRKIFA